MPLVSDPCASYTVREWRSMGSVAPGSCPPTALVPHGGGNGEGGNREEWAPRKVGTEGFKYLAEPLILSPNVISVFQPLVRARVQMKLDLGWGAQAGEGLDPGRMFQGPTSP